VNILGLIPARGGSKTIPKKNITPLLGKPLLAYTCQAALASRHLTRVILNTDDAEIAQVGREYGVEVPFMRPLELATDETLILPVIQHTLKRVEEQQDFFADIVVLLQPTSPLRRAEHIDAALELLLDSDADSVVSVVSVPHNFNPLSVMQRSEEGFLTPFWAGPQILRRQDKPRVYARNGPAILAIRRAVLERGQIFGDKMLPYEMSTRASMDIDDPQDLALAEFYLKRMQAEDRD
jgi:CMP-N,N'-diacetyllegionaminic acid synthase